MDRFAFSNTTTHFTTGRRLEALQLSSQSGTASALHGHLEVLIMLMIESVSAFLDGFTDCTENRRRKTLVFFPFSERLCWTPHSLKVNEPGYITAHTHTHTVTLLKDAKVKAWVHLETCSAAPVKLFQNKSLHKVINCVVVFTRTIHFLNLSVINLVISTKIFH